ASVPLSIEHHPAKRDDVELRHDRLIGVLRLIDPRGPDQSSASLLAPTLAGLLSQARTLDQARVEARIDPLTGLRNRRWADESLQSEIGRAQRSGLPLAVLALDLDGLKPINDTFGHATGDAVLRHISLVFQSVLRRSDCAARVGGDEFLIILPATDRAGAERLAERILERLEDDPPIHADEPLRIGASIGSAMWREGWDADCLIAAADAAMYDDKRAGRESPGQLPKNGSETATNQRLPA
ncbi:MAG: GGDEF domain-containing protein, partial [Phycisphaerales bacterium]|nr:GGDEF domain-containing protein [Phycisphaerales bacterium]